MTRRIDIELTSSRDDGTWTWRAPGARQPRGSLEGTLLPDGAKVGDILRADAEFDLEGIVVTSVLAPKGDPRVEKVDRIEIIGSGRDSAPGGVSVVLVPGGGGRRRDEDGRGGSSPTRRCGPGRRPDGATALRGPPPAASAAHLVRLDPNVVPDQSVSLGPIVTARAARPARGALG